MKIQGKTFFVTGGASGLGEATVKFLVSKGGNVVIADLNGKKAQKVAMSINSGNVLACKVDVTNEDMCKEAFEMTMNKFGRVDCVINCAGGAMPRRVLSKSGKVHPQKHFERAVAINLFGTFQCLRLGAQKMLQHEPDEDGERGVIINVASVAAFDGQIGQCSYSASKAAICGMTLPLARDLGVHGIRTCTIAPGIIATPLTKMMPKKVINNLVANTSFPNRFGQPSEFADACRFIIENRYMNGEVIRLDGGIRMPKL